MNTPSNPDRAANVVQLLHAAAPVKQAAVKRRLLGLAEVMARCRIKKSAVYSGMANRTFPRCRPLPGSRAVAWVEEEIDAWIDAVAAGAEGTKGGAQ